MTDDLRQRIEGALTAAAHQCDGACGLDERACYDAHPITWSAMAAGTTHIDGPVTAITDTVLAIVQPELDRLRKDMRLWCDAVASAEKLRQHQAADADRYEEQLRAERDDALADLFTEQCRKEDALATIDRVRALASDMRTWCSPHGIATDYAQRIDDAVDGPEAGQ
ncbi:hypothetical protein [Streptomyces sp. NPDC059649]|uniref:hypothetical protein n=1 Tax=Streptomyces sp. NPDC059649 TaxID=3346895 RepID=UPI0036C7302F